MPHSIGLFYFSGTGNTQAVAKLFANEFHESSAKVDIIKIEDILKSKRTPETRQYDMIGIGYPVHAFNAPRIIFNFIKTLPLSQQKKTFLFKTAGDHFIMGGATSMLRGRLKEKGYEVFHESLLVMPANILIKYDDRFSKQLCNRAISLVKTACNEILSEEVSLQKNSLPLRVFAKAVSGLENFGSRFLKLHFKVKKSCSLCGSCVKRCPMGNIRKSDDKISFGWNCLICMRCFYLCPSKAITLRVLGFIILKDGYKIEKIINDQDIKDDFVTEDTQGYYKRFYNYIHKK